VLLIDNSAWARLASGRLDPDRAERVAAWIGDLQLATCLPFLLEAGYSARSGHERSAMMADLASSAARSTSVPEIGQLTRRDRRMFLLSGLRRH
jgi:hypothetical protein